MKIPKVVTDLMASPEAIKILATVDASGVPNAAAVWSFRPAGEDKVAFADVALKKTKENLERTRKASVLIVKLPETSFQMKGTFLGFQTSGPLYEGCARALMERMKLTVKGVGVISIEDIYGLPPAPGKG